MNTNQPPSEQKPKTVTRFPGAIWHWLIEPSSAIQDVALRRKSRLLSIFLLMMFFLFALLNIANYITMPGYAMPPPSLGGYVFLISSYVLNRIKYYNLAAVLAVSMVPIVIFLKILTNTSTNPVVTLNYLILGLLLSLILLSVRSTIILAGISIIGTLLMPLVAAAAIPDYRVIIGPLSTIIIGAALAVVSMYHRNQIERDRQAELKKYREQLEDLVGERTSELSMANEQLQQEIVERKQAEEALRESEEGLVLAIASTGGALWDEKMDPEASFEDQPGETHFSSPEKKLLGYNNDQPLDRMAIWDRHVLPEDRVQREKKQRDHFEGRTEFLDHEYRVRTKDGKVRWIHGRSRIIRNEQGAPIRWIGIDWDITKRKQLEEELRQHREYLEDLVQARTTELSQANKQLQAEIIQRKQAEKKNEATLREKEVLLKEVHHRVKNNLQVVSSLLYLQSRGIDDETILEKFTESQNRIRSMALVHESLSRTKGLNRINFADYAQNLVIHVFRSFSGGSGGISPIINVENLFLSIDTAIPCGLIINELVSNAIKYGFPGERNQESKKEIQVTFRLQAGEYVLTVSDNGIGLPEDFDIQNTKSLGLKLVDSLVDQLEGTLELQREGGTAFKVVFTELN